MLLSFHPDCHQSRSRHRQPSSGFPKELLKLSSKEAFLKCSLKLKSPLPVPPCLLKYHSKSWLGSLYSYLLTICLLQFREGQFHPSTVGIQKLGVTSVPLSLETLIPSIIPLLFLGFNHFSPLPHHCTDLYHHIIHLEIPKDLPASTCSPLNMLNGAAGETVSAWSQHTQPHTWASSHQNSK